MVIADIAELFTDYNWRNAIAVASERNFSDLCRLRSNRYPPIGLEHVDTVIAAVPGENDGPSWLLIVSLQHPQATVPSYAIIDSGCDYTGWDCQAGGSWTFCWDQDDLDKMLTNDQQDRLEIAYPTPVKPLIHT